MNKQIIILNGTSSAGKTSVAKYISDQTDQQFYHLQWDTFLKTLPDDKKDLSVLFRQAAHDILNKGQDVIMDVVCVPAQTFDDLVASFSKHATTTIQLKASPEVLKEREQTRFGTDEERTIGMAGKQYDTMYNQENHSPYDLEFDSGSMSTQEMGDIIMDHIKLKV